jgi:hypothetical protein
VRFRPDPAVLAAVAVVAATGILAALAPDGAGPRGGAAAPARPAPEFPSADPGHWINSAPLRIADLRGQVVLLEVWTFG